MSTIFYIDFFNDLKYFILFGTVINFKYLFKSNSHNLDFLSNYFRNYYIKL